MLTFANISQLCRICLRHLRQINEQQPQQDPHRNKSSYNPKALPHLAKLLNQFFAIDVFQQPDTFPQSICALCYNAIEYFHQLCTVAEQSNEMLMRLTINIAVGQSDRTEDDVEANSHDNYSLPLVKAEPVEDELQNQNNNDEEADVNTDVNMNAEDEGVADAADPLEAPNDDDDDDADAADAVAAAANKRKLLACEQCGKQVYKLPYLEAHIRSVHEGHPKPFLCRNCDKAFTRYEQLRSHVRNVHPSVAAATTTSRAALSEELELMCEQCNRRYSTKNALGEHLKRHAKEKPHICEHCGVAKVTRTELLTHLRIHNPDWEKFKCKQCPQLFRHKSAISRHVRVVHEGQRRFQCGHCQKRFGTHASQMRHERLHIETF